MNNNQLPENITRENYEFVMFNLLEGLYDERTEKTLLSQIEKNPLFRFEWEQWKKSRITEVAIPDLGDEAYWNSIKSIAADKPVMAVIHRRKTLLRIAAVLLPLLIGAGLLWLNTGQQPGTPASKLVKSEDNRNKGVNNNTLVMPENAGEQQISSDKDIATTQQVLKTAGSNDHGGTTAVSHSDTVKPVIPYHLVISEKIQRNDPVNQSQKPGNEGTPVRKKRFSITVNDPQPATPQTASAEVQKTRKLSRLFVNPQIKKYKTETGEVWIEIIGDGETVYARAAESIEK